MPKKTLKYNYYILDLNFQGNYYKYYGKFMIYMGHIPFPLLLSALEAIMIVTNVM